MTTLRRVTHLTFTVAFATMALATHAAAAEVDSGKVLNELHHANQKEIAMGKLAEKEGQSKDVKSFGKMLVTDHTAADKKVAAMAKQEKVTLEPAPSMKDEMASLPKGAEFDMKFAQLMVDDHKKAIADVTAARDETGDPKLKKLLDEILPILQKHEETAQKIVDSESKRASR